jgi:ABC-type bacteriocin/lantibiotic exporter with double-glycine peptidase domain
MAHLNCSRANSLSRLRSIDPVYQGEISECGLACIVMLLQALGVDATLAETRERHGSPLRGMSLADLVSVLGAHGVEADPVRFTSQALSELPLPAILHVGGNHYVLVMRAAGGLYHVFDPAVGAHLMHGGLLGGMATGYAVVLAQPETLVTPLPPKRRGDRWKNLMSAAGGGRLIGLMLIIGAFSFITPFFVGHTINQLIGSTNMHAYWSIGLAFLLATLGVFLFERHCGRMLLGCSANLAILSLNRGFNLLVGNRLRYFARRAPGDLVERFIGYGGAVRERIRISNSIICSLSVGAAAIAVMAGLQPWLALISLLGIAVSGVLTQRYAREVQTLRMQAEQAAASQNQFLIETMQGIIAWKSALALPRRINCYLDHAHRVINTWHRQADLGLRQQLAYKLLGNLELLIMLGVAASAMMAGKLTFGGFYAFAFVRQVALSAATQGYEGWISSRSMRVVEARASDMFEHPSDSRQDVQALLKMGLRVHGVRFQHEGSPLALEGIKLYIHRGQKIAVLGASGSGKTTLLKLLCGLERPQTGTLWVDGTEVADWESLRGHCYLQTAHDILFSGSVLENISMFELHPDKAACWTLMESIGIASRIRDLPAGIDTHVSEMASSLSAGERQRLLVARVLYAGRSVGMLDEPTANLDAQSARLVMTAITAAPNAAIVVTHDSTHLDLFDAVYHLHDGRLHCVRSSESAAIFS